MANPNSNQGRWNELVGKIRQTWGRLSDDEISQMKGNWQELTGKLQQTYGYTREQAEEQVRRFRTQNKA